MYLDAKRYIQIRIIGLDIKKCKNCKIINIFFSLTQIILTFQVFLQVFRINFLDTYLTTD